MVAFNPTVETERKEGGLPQSMVDGVYLTRFDTYETESEWVYRCRMPDVQLVQVETAMQYGELVIRGKVRFGPEAILPQTASGPLCFFRSFPICGEGNMDQVSTNFKNGVLTVRLPKRVKLPLAELT